MDNNSINQIKNTEEEKIFLKSLLISNVCSEIYVSTIITSLSGSTALPYIGIDILCFYSFQES